MKKFLLSSTVVILFALYVYKTFGTPAVEPETSTTPDATSDATSQQQIAVAEPNPSEPEDDGDEDGDEDDVITKPTTDTDVNEIAETKKPVVVTPTTPTPTPEPTPATVTTPTPTPAPVEKNTYKDGTFTGPVTDAFFGDMQVKVTIANGKITNVQLVKFPNDRPNSITINTNALTKWKSETITTQSANVNIVSGATESSVAFRQSLAAALTSAKN